MVLFFSCSDSDDLNNQVDQPDETNFYALTVGNSWVYKYYQYNRNTETYEDTGIIDSVNIVGTEDFSGDEYFIFKRVTTGNEEGVPLCNANGEAFEYLKEEQGDLVNEEGAVIFTNNNYEERLIIENEYHSIYETLVEGESTMDVEAGIFTCINSERYAKTHDGEVTDGLDRFYYADGYGLIYNTLSSINNDTPRIIKRLDSYEIE